MAGYIIAGYLKGEDNTISEYIVHNANGEPALMPNGELTKIPVQSVDEIVDQCGEPINAIVRGGYFKARKGYPTISEILRQTRASAQAPQAPAPQVPKPVAERVPDALVSREYNRFLTGDKLRERVKTSHSQGKRNAYHRMNNWIQNQTQDNRVGVLYGLCRTGQTTILHQIADYCLGKGIKVAYATYPQDQVRFDAVLEAVRRLSSEGYKVILLDEVARTKYFYDGAPKLGEMAGSKVVIAGTESLMLWYTLIGPLFGRSAAVKTTPMDFSEYMKLKPESDISRFMKYGGTLWYEERDGDKPITTDRYLMNCAVDNIQTSLALMEDRPVPPEEEILGRISRETLLEELRAMGKAIALPRIQESLQENWGGILSLKIQCPKRQSEADVIDNCTSYKVPIASSSINNYVTDAFIPCLIHINFLSETSERWSDGREVKRLVVTQPYLQAAFVRRALSEMEEYQNSSYKDSSAMLQLITYGIVLENIVHLEARARYLKRDSEYDNVVRFRMVDGRDIDVCVIHDGNRASLIEVKLNKEKIKASTNQTKGQDRWLTDEEITFKVKSLHGVSDVSKIVMYLGDTDAEPDENGVRWVNVNEWLLGRVEL